MRIRQLYGAGSANADAVAYLDFIEGTTLLQVQWGVSVDMVADNSIMALQLSTASVGQFTTNDANGVISTIRAYGSLVTSGLQISNMNLVVPLNLALPRGTRVYLHAAIATTAYVCNAHFLVR